MGRVQETLRLEFHRGREASLRELAEATQGIRGEIGHAQRALAEVKALEQGRARQMDVAADSLRRLEAVMAGSGTRGARGRTSCSARARPAPARPARAERGFRGRRWWSTRSGFPAGATCPSTASGRAPRRLAPARGRGRPGRAPRRLGDADRAGRARPHPRDVEVPRSRSARTRWRSWPCPTRSTSPCPKCTARGSGRACCSSPTRWPCLTCWPSTV